MCCSGFLKTMMFLFNGVIFAAGAAVLGVGVWVKVDSNSLLGVLDTIDDAPPELAQLANVGYLLIGIGAVLVVMGFLGCCGAVKESRCMLMMFFIIVLVIFIAEVAGAVVILVFQPLVEEILEELGDKMAVSIKKDYGKNGSESMTSLWDGTMKEFKCCGYNNYTDFEESPFVTTTTHYPTTCCDSTSVSCTFNLAKLSNVDGCFRTFIKLIEDNALLLGGVALGIAALEIAAMVVSMTLYKKIGKDS